MLYAPDKYYLLSPAMRRELVNGAGSKGYGWLVPDTIWGLSIREAANIHDYMYSLGTSIEDKEQADRVFLNNMLRIIEAANHFGSSLLAYPRRFRAKNYYRAVKYFGGPDFWTTTEE